MQAKATSSPSQTKSTKPDPSAKPTRKSFRIAVQSTQKSRKQGGSSKQSLPEIEEILSSPEESSLRDPEITPKEQGPPKSPTVRKDAAPTELSPELTLSALKKSIAKRKLSPKHPFTQGPTEKSLLSLVQKEPRKQLPQCPHPYLLNCSKGVWFGANYEGSIF